MDQNDACFRVEFEIALNPGYMGTAPSAYIKDALELPPMHISSIRSGNSSESCPPILMIKIPIYHLTCKLSID